MMPIRAGSTQPVAANIFFVAYTKDGEDVNRLAIFDCDRGAPFHARAVRGAQPADLLHDPVAVDHQAVALAVAEHRFVVGVPQLAHLLGLALGARTFKLKFGHRGANHPVIAHRLGSLLLRRGRELTIPSLET